MTPGRSLLLLIVLSLLFAGVVGFVSRAPAELRTSGGLHLMGNSALSPPVEFPDELIHRHAAYRGPGYLSFVLGTVLRLTALVLIAWVFAPAWFTGIQRMRGGWPVHVLVLIVSISALLFVISLPLAYVRGYVIEHAWDRSTQGLFGWLSDQAISLGVGAVILGVSALAFYALVRWQPRWWWIVAWAAFTALSAILVFLWPVVIAPLFNRFTPLEDPVLKQRIESLASEAGIELDQVLVADASRRTVGENAYVTGIGGTRRMVLYDTLLERSQDQVAFIAAHELGHQRERHVTKNLWLSSLGLFIGFAVLGWLAHRSGIWSSVGASGIADPKAIGLLLLFATVAGLVTSPLQLALSRRFETDADRIAIELTDDPQTPARSFYSLALSSLSDLRPPALAVALLYTHPPIVERIEHALVGTPEQP